MMKKIATATAFCALMAGTAQAETFGVAMSLFDDNYLTVLRHNIERHAGELGVEVQMEDAQGDIARQQSQIENFVAAGVDGIIVMLVDADSGQAMSRIAEQADVPLVFVNMLPANMDEFPAKQAWVGSDEEQAGEDDRRHCDRDERGVERAGAGPAPSALEPLERHDCTSSCSYRQP